MFAAFKWLIDLIGNILLAKDVVSLGIELGKTERLNLVSFKDYKTFKE